MLTVVTVFLLLVLACSSTLAATGVGPQRFPGVVHKTIVGAEYIGYGVLSFPETIVFDNRGLLYTSLADGSIRTVNTTNNEIQHWAYVVPNLSPEVRALCGSPEYTQVCGRPLGLAFDKLQRWMYVADEVKGLLRISTTNPSIVEVLATEHEGRVFRIANSVVVGDSGRYIYFTVSNDDYYFVDFMKMTLASRPAGRLLRFDILTRQVDTLMDGIRIANGLTIAGPEPREFLVLAVSGTGQLYRYWIEGGNAGTFDVLVDDLGGYPDNVSPDGDGGFYVSLLSDRSSTIDSVTNSEELKSLFLMDLVSPWIPLTWMQLSAHIKHYDNKGKLIEDISEPTGTLVGPMSGAYVHDGYFYTGSFLLPVITKIGLYNGNMQVARIDK